MLHMIIRLVLTLHSTDLSSPVNELAPITTTAVWSDNAGHWHRPVSNQRTHAEDTCHKQARKGESWDACTRLGVVR